MQKEPTTKPVSVRLPESVYQEVESIATKESRSISNVIVLLLRDALGHRAPTAGETKGSK